jgi:hypothetical protein
MKKIITKLVKEDISSKNFYQAISIYLTKTQVVNRKLSCSSNIVFLNLNLSRDKTEVLIAKLQNEHDVEESIEEILSKEGIEFVRSSIGSLKTFNHEDSGGIYLSLDRMLPRNSQKFPHSVTATFIGKLESLLNNGVTIKISIIQILKKLLQSSIH